MANVNDLLTIAKNLLPPNFVCKVADPMLIAYLNLTLEDINMTTPVTYYSLETMPASWNYIVVFGSTIYANLFLIMNYALKDFNYSDNGLSLNIDREGKLSRQHQLSIRAFEDMKWNLKKAEIWKQQPAGLGSPRFQSQISSFMKILFGSSYTPR